MPRASVFLSAGQPGPIPNILRCATPLTRQLLHKSPTVRLLSTAQRPRLKMPTPAGASARSFESKVQDLADSLKALDPQDFSKDPILRGRVVLVAQIALQKLETPWEKMLRVGWYDVRTSSSPLLVLPTNYYAHAASSRPSSQDCHRSGSLRLSRKGC